MPVGESFATNLVKRCWRDRRRGCVTSSRPSSRPGLSVGLSVPVVDGVAALDLQGDAPETLAGRGRADPGPARGHACPGAGDHRAAGDDRWRGGRPARRGGAVRRRVRRGVRSRGHRIGRRPLRAAARPRRVRLRRRPAGGRRTARSRATTVRVGGRRARRRPDRRGDRRRSSGARRAPPVAGRRNDGRHPDVRRHRLTQPSWDASGRLWVLDRGPSGARVLVSDDGVKVRDVRVPGVSGTDARRILVSRDGTRLIALVRRSDGDQLVAARVMLGNRGRVARVVDSTVIRTLTGQQAIDIAWTEAAQIAVVSPARPGELFEVETVAADGATVGVDTLSTVVTGRVIGLAGEPYTETPVYAVTRDALVDIRTGERIPARASGASTTPAESTGAVGAVAAARARGRIGRMTLVSALLDAGADLLLGSACVGCGEPGRVLCRDCRSGLPARRSRHGRRRLRSGWPVRSRPGRTTAPARDGRRPQGARLLGLTRPLGELLATSVLAAAGPAAPLCSSRCRRVRRRSGPAGTTRPSRMTRRAARTLRTADREVGVARLLRTRPGVADQAGLGADQRRANLAGSMASPARAVRRHCRPSRARPGLRRRDHHRRHGRARRSVRSRRPASPSSPSRPSQPPPGGTPTGPKPGIVAQTFRRSR